MRALFLIPGDLRRKTGGYGYDRRVIAEAQAQGFALEPVALPGGFPFPAAEERQSTRDLLHGMPASVPLLIDGLAYGAFDAAMLQALRGPVIALVHHPLAYENGLAPDEAARLKDSERAALAQAAAIIVTSAPTKDLLVAEYDVAATRIVVAPPGTDQVTFASGSGRQTPALLGVGSLTIRKAWTVLIDALALCRDHDWTLTLVGTGPEKIRLEAQIAAHGLADRIILAGEVSADELARIYDRSDLFVMPSLYEGFGMALTEAIAHGLPCIASDGVVAVRHLPEEAVRVVEAGEVAALADAIRSALDADQRAAMAAAARAAAPFLPRWADTAHRIIATLRSAA